MVLGGECALWFKQVLVAGFLGLVFVHVVWKEGWCVRDICCVACFGGFGRIVCLVECGGCCMALLGRFGLWLYVGYVCCLVVLYLLFSGFIDVLLM